MIHSLPASDHTALAAFAAARQAGEPAALCTITAIEGSFSRRLGAQLTVRQDGTTAGDLADGCLEAALATDALVAMASATPVLKRYGAGSPAIDFRLPCGGGLDIAIDPVVPNEAATGALARLEAREPATLSLWAGETHFARSYIPALRLVICGAGPEPEALLALAGVFGTAAEWLHPASAGTSGLSLDKAPVGVAVDPWTAIILLFHDHDWEAALLPWAVASPAFMVGAQGGDKARANREVMLAASGFDAATIARVRGPVGLIGRARDARVLALSILAETVARYEALMPG